MTAYNKTKKYKKSSPYMKKLEDFVDEVLHNSATTLDERVNLPLLR